MYSKITHQITEEHFGHPAATQIKKIVDKNKVPAKPMGGSAMSQAAFQSTVQNYWNNYLNNMNSIISNISGSELDLQKAEDALFNNIDSFGQLTKSYYGTEFGEKIMSYTRILGLTMVGIVRLLRDHGDIKNLVNNRIYYMVATEMATTMTNANNLWDFQTVRNAISGLADAWIAQSKAILGKDTTAQQKAKDSAQQITNAIATAISTGVINQHPEMFTLP